jgi:hypothetical protein
LAGFFDEAEQLYASLGNEFLAAHFAQDHAVCRAL